MSEPTQCKLKSLTTVDDTPRLAIDVNDADHAQGPAGAPVTLVEYGDYECPYCANVWPIIHQLQTELGPRLRFVFRHFPMNGVHPRAAAAAEAAEAAAAQGKFWPMHDLLYEHQKDLADVDLSQLALRAGLEIYQFDADLSAGRYAKRVRDDFNGGVRSGVNGTPTLFINGARYDGDRTLDAIRAAILRAEAQSTTDVQR